MSYALPPTDHAARTLMGDVSTIAEILHPANVGKLLTTTQARLNAAASFEASPAASRITYVIIRADDERWLVSFGRRGGMRREWNFGDNR
jgi:hypothetical protein